MKVIIIENRFSWKERKVRGVFIGRRLALPKAWSTVSCEAPELCKVNVFLASEIPSVNIERHSVKQTRMILSVCVITSEATQG